MLKKHYGKPIKFYGFLKKIWVFMGFRPEIMGFLWVFPKINKNTCFFIDFGLKCIFNGILAKKQVLGTIHSYFTASPDGVLLELLVKVVKTIANHC